eukprot:TRINITY_DN10146_c0_g1_i1.p1 TRINITY_DN10146_c0_g1~~TRINITY_DN10146_c0_g1_i1.p1  ORF type:complete len:2150 (-),score=588.81 TRINITY_DN10146_c0_g1_i1:49-6171(-)
MKCKAVWAGWGHASENPRLPDLLESVGIVFIGPHGNAMRLLGDKISSTIVAQAADVPTMGWSGSDIKVKIPEEFVEIDGRLQVSPEVYRRACVYNVDEGYAACKKIGYPVMIKASEGGGGKGIRKCDDEKYFEQTYRQVEGEVPGSPIFIMKLGTNCRHLEVQVLADNYGEAISLFGRDCSVQRRHQKVIEEAPVSVCDRDYFIEMEKAAVALAKCVSYVSAGTVEYLYSPEDKKFYFLELNPRLQVEHPCTEFVTDINLPACQLQVAMGIPLSRIPDIRSFYGVDRWGTSPINFENPANPPKPNGHVIAARITAENPDDGFKPSGGSLIELNFRSQRNVWGYFSVGASGGLHEFADSQFGHVFAWGERREKARLNLIMALKDLSIRGDFRTPVEYVIKMVESNDFKKNQIHTRWLDNLIEGKVALAERPPEMVSVVCATVYLANQKIAQAINECRSAFERGHLIQMPGSVSVDFLLGGKKYFVKATMSGPLSFWVSMNDSHIEVLVHYLSDGGTLISFGESSYITYLTEEVDKYRLVVNGKTAILSKENDPSIIRTSSPGKLVRYLVADGEHVEGGMEFVEVEVMKMYMTLSTQEAGTIRHTKSPGAILEAGDVIAQLLLDDPSKIQKSEQCSEKFPEEFNTNCNGKRSDQIVAHALDALNSVLQGYQLPEPRAEAIIENYINDLRKCLSDPALPLVEVHDVLSKLSGRIPASLEETTREYLLQYERSLGSMFSSFPSAEIAKAIQAQADAFPASQAFERSTFEAKVLPLSEVIAKYEHSLKLYGRKVLLSLLNSYLDVESLFTSGKTELQVVLELREKYEAAKAFEIARAHMNDGPRTILALRLLEWLASYASNTNAEKDVMVAIANLKDNRNSSVALQAKKNLMTTSLPSLNTRKATMEHELTRALEVDDGQQLKNLVARASNFFDVITSFFFHEKREFRVASLEIYIRKAYSEHALSLVRPLSIDEHSCALFSFASPASDGLIIPFSSISSMDSDTLAKLLAAYPEKEKTKVLHIVLQGHAGDLSDDARSKTLQEWVEEHSQQWLENKMQRITFCIYNHESEPLYYSFSQTESETSYQENTLLRHMEPALAFQLELDRMSNYNINYIPTGGTGRQHLYFASRKDESGKLTEKRIFVRCLLNGEAPTEENTDVGQYWNYQCEKVLVETIAALDIIREDPKYGATDCNHIFINMVPVIPSDCNQMMENIVLLLKKHGEKIFSLRITEGEVVSNFKNGSEITRYRWFLQNEAGFLQRGISVRCFREENTIPPVISDSYVQNVKLISQDREVPEVKSLLPYQAGNRIQFNRYFAQSRGTSYVYDIPAVFAKAITRTWRQKGLREPTEVLKFKELQLNEAGELVPLTHDKIGTNTVGVVVWKLTMFTPEYPEGRDAIVLANDITLQNGSMCNKEDFVFRKGSELARKEGIPRIYISANSGARIGLADEVKQKFKIAWKGTGTNTTLDYLYLDPKDYEELNKNKQVVIATLINEGGEERYRITDVIGEKDGIGVENLQGSGMIAGETSRAYDSIFTISLVSCRSVGIGAYLVRLGQRVVQVESSSILLTGSQALNKLLGREVYANNQQIGGPQVMYHNGISHLTVASDLEGVEAIVNWLSYVPKDIYSMVPIFKSTDPLEREVTYKPTPLPYDPRWMLEGTTVEEGDKKTYLTGFFDKGSWTETLAGWAKNVVVGRARLGGIPVGVLCVEPRTTEVRIPADPASLDSQEVVCPQAGLVWFPNSAFKTAQAIKDFNQEGLPLIIFANWRGFSGGVRDMFGEILKYGSYIVDALVAYKQPVLSYIPPHAELRGGSWVVVDPTINSDMMEMYADNEAHGNVLEPDGTVEIKFRKEDCLKAMQRLDQDYSKLLAQFVQEKEKEKKAQLKSKLLEYEKTYLPLYHQAALEFANLHDTPGRMKAKNVIHDVVEWKNSREYFYWRLYRRVLEEFYVKQIVQNRTDLSHSQAISLLHSWIPGADLQSNKATTEQLLESKEEIIKKIHSLQGGALSAAINNLAPAQKLEMLAQFIQSLDAQQQEELKKIFN